MVFFEAPQLHFGMSRRDRLDRRAVELVGDARAPLRWDDVQALQPRASGCGDADRPSISLREENTALEAAPASRTSPSGYGYSAGGKMCASASSEASR
jgi:hypothetical protein